MAWEEDGREEPVEWADEGASVADLEGADDVEVVECGAMCDKCGGAANPVSLLASLDAIAVRAGIHLFWYLDEQGGGAHARESGLTWGRRWRSVARR